MFAAIYRHRTGLRPGSVSAYLFAFAAVAVATALRLLLAPWLSGVQFITFFPAVIVTTLIGGMAAGGLACGLSLLAAVVFVIAPARLVADIPALSLFLLVAGADIAIIGALRLAVARVRRLHAQLRDSEGMFRGLLETAPDAVVIADAKGRIVLVNAQAERMFGYAQSELLGEPVELLMPQRDRDRHRQHAAGFVIDPKPRAMGSGINLTALRKDGSDFPVEVSLSPFERQGRLLISSAIRDISARRQTEAALTAAREKALFASRAKSDFLSHMSHELRTPLNAVLGFAQLLELDMDGTLSARQKGYVEDVLKAGRHLLDLLNDVLDLAAVEAGGLKMTIEPTSVAPVMQQAVEFLHPLAAKAGVSLTMDRPPPVAALADSLRLRQLLLNLTSNAIKYNRAGGTVRLEVSVPAAGRVRITVADTGIGIPADRQAALFTPFERLGAERSAIEGTGVGLALSRRLVEAMGGSIGFDSVEGEGSRFWIDLPAIPEAESTPIVA